MRHRSTHPSGSRAPHASHRALCRAAAVCCTLLLGTGCSSKSDSDASKARGDAGANLDAGGTPRNGGTGGSGGGANGEGPRGSVEVLTADAALRGPTTAAVRGNDVWVVNGQLSGLFGGNLPALPFNVVSVPLTGGAVGATVINLPGDSFYPEGIAAAADGTLYVASLELGTIVKVAADSTTAVPFVPAGIAQRGAVGVTVDDTRGLLWFCDSSPVAAVPGAAIVGVSLEDGTETVRHAMPNRAPVAAGTDAGVGNQTAAAPVPAFCNDVIVDPTGNLFATDSSGRIFRVPAAAALTANSAQVWLEVPEIAPPMPGGSGANGLELVGGSLIISNSGLVSVNPNSAAPATTVHAIPLTRDGAPETLCGPDGLQAVPGSSTDLIVVENGSCNPPSGDGDRVVRIRLAL